MQQGSDGGSGGAVKPLSSSPEGSKAKSDSLSKAEVKPNGTQGADGKSPLVGAAVVGEEAASVQVIPLLYSALLSPYQCLSFCKLVILI